MKGKIIQISTCGVEANQTTQTSYVITILTDQGEVYRKTSLSIDAEWERVI